MQMKILFSSGLYYPYVGGGEISFMNLISNIKLGNEIVIISSNLSNIGGEVKYEDLYGTQVITFPEIYVNLNENNQLEFDEKHYLLEEFIGNYKPDIIHCNYGDYEGFSYSIIQIANKLNIPCIINLCGSDVWHFPELDNRRKILLNNIVNSANGIICKTQSMQKKLIQSYKISSEKIRVISSGIDVDQIQVKVGNYSVFAGRLEKKKGIDQILNAFILLDKNIELKVFGDGSLYDELNEFIKNNGLENIKIYGNIDNSDLLSCIDDSKFVIIGSKYEGCPNIILEAFSKGKPVIGFDVPGVNELVINQQNGILVEYGDINALANQIDNLYKNNELIEKMGNNALNYVTQNHNLSTISQQVLDFYQDILS